MVAAFEVGNDAFESGFVFAGKARIALFGFVDLDFVFFVFVAVKDYFKGFWRKVFDRLVHGELVIFGDAFEDFVVPADV